MFLIRSKKGTGVQPIAIIRKKENSLKKKRRARNITSFYGVRALHDIVDANDNVIEDKLLVKVGGTCQTKGTNRMHQVASQVRKNAILGAVIEFCAKGVPMSNTEMSAKEQKLRDVLGISAKNVEHLGLPNPTEWVISPKIRIQEAFQLVGRNGSFSVEKILTKMEKVPASETPMFVRFGGQHVQLNP